MLESSGFHLQWLAPFGTHSGSGDVPVDQVMLLIFSSDLPPPPALLFPSAVGTLS